MHSQDSDQTGQMPRSVSLLGSTGHFVGFVLLWLNIKVGKNFYMVHFISWLTYIQYRTYLDWANKSLSNEKLHFDWRCWRWRHNHFQFGVRQRKAIWLVHGDSYVKIIKCWRSKCMQNVSVPRDHFLHHEAKPLLILLEQICQIWLFCQLICKCNFSQSDWHSHSRA